MKIKKFQNPSGTIDFQAAMKPKVIDPLTAKRVELATGYQRLNPDDLAYLETHPQAEIITDNNGNKTVSRGEKPLESEDKYFAGAVAGGAGLANGAVTGILPALEYLYHPGNILNDMGYAAIGSVINGVADASYIGAGIKGFARNIQQKAPIEKYILPIAGLIGGVAGGVDTIAKLRTVNGFNAAKRILKERATNISLDDLKKIKLKIGQSDLMKAHNSDGAGGFRSAILSCGAQKSTAAHELGHHLQQTDAGYFTNLDNLIPDNYVYSGLKYIDKPEKVAEEFVSDIISELIYPNQIIKDAEVAKRHKIVRDIIDKNGITLENWKSFSGTITPREKVPALNKELNDKIQTIIGGLDMDNNYYLMHQTLSDNFSSIWNSGFRLVSPSLEGTTYTATPQRIQEALNAIKQGRGHKGSDGLILFKFPKSHPGYQNAGLIRGEAGISEPIIEWEALNGGDVRLLPNRYIDKMITVSDIIKHKKGGFLKNAK